MCIRGDVACVVRKVMCIRGDVACVVTCTQGDVYLEATTSIPWIHIVSLLLKDTKMAFTAAKKTCHAC